MIEIVVPIVCTAVIGVIGALVKVALVDRDRRLDTLDEQFKDFQNSVNSLQIKVAVLDNQNSTLLKEAEKLERKLDSLEDM